MKKLGLIDIDLKLPILVLISNFLIIKLEPVAATSVGNNVVFNRQLTGVSFSPYTKIDTNPDGRKSPEWHAYNLDNIKTMLKVINTKFSRVISVGGGTKSVPFTVLEPINICYSNPELLVAEAASLLNQHRSRSHDNGTSTPMTTTISLLHDFPIQNPPTAEEIKQGLECFERANSHFRGTVQGILFSTAFVQTVAQATQMLDLIRAWKDPVHKIEMKIGTRQECKEVLEDPDLDMFPELSALRRGILNESDFAICDIVPGSHNLPSGPENGFITVRDDLIGYRRQYSKVNPNIEVMGQTRWPSKGSDPWENIDNLKRYWEVVNEWSTQTGMPMWFYESFDQPWKSNWAANASHHGWWKLGRNEDINMVDGYIEKIHDPTEQQNYSPSSDSETPTSPWVYVGATIGILMAFVILAFIILLYRRLGMLEIKLEKKDIREFIYGVNDDYPTGPGDPSLVTISGTNDAFRFPYDRSYEIPKEKLFIVRTSLLGAGQFGAVYKAILDKGRGDTQVALKMAKSDCPQSALKGILSEIKILIYLGKHPNIVSILGAYTAELHSGVVYVATELCVLGSLEKYLRKSQRKEDSHEHYLNLRYSRPSSQKLYENLERIQYEEMIRWAYEIACGMEYLGSKHIVHADLATRNVLLTSDKTAKITDFGLSRRLYDYTSYVKKQQEPLPWRWMAIESLRKMEFSERSDVWSYGVTLWEIFALGDLPYPGLAWNLEFVDNLVNGMRMKCPPYATALVYDLMVDCWHTEPKERPTFTDLKLTTEHLTAIC